MFLLVYALQFNVYLGPIKDPLILEDNSGMLVDVYQELIDQLQNSFTDKIQTVFVNDQSLANISLNFERNSDQEKGIMLIEDSEELNYTVYDVLLQYNQVSKPILSENYIFVYPSLIVTLFTRIVWELFFNYILIMFPWIMFCANLMVLCVSKEHKTYSKKIQVSLQILIGNEQTNLNTLVMKFFFLFTTFLISAIVFIDFIYVVSNAIQRQNFNSLNDLAINQFQLCLVENDTFITDMVERYRDITYNQKSDIQQCMDVIDTNPNAVIFVGEFKYGQFVQKNPQFQNLKYQLKYNSFKSYVMLMNQSIDFNVRQVIYLLIQQLNQSIDQLQPQRYDVDIRKKYQVQLFYMKSAAVSLIFSNKTFLLSSLLTSVLAILFIQCSILRKQCELRKNRLPYHFVMGRQQVRISETNSTEQRLVDEMN